MRSARASIIEDRGEMPVIAIALILCAVFVPVGFSQ